MLTLANMSTLDIELNIALIPEGHLGNQHVTLSQRLAKHFPAIVELSGPHNRLNLVPHLTLYQTPSPISNLEAMNTVLLTLATRYQSMQLTGTGYAYNAGERSLEVSYKITDSLVALQNELIAGINVLRNDIYLERDPAGNLIKELLTAPGKLGENIAKTGYAEVGDPKTGGLFRPHVTLNWFKAGTGFDITSPYLPVARKMTGSFDALGMYVLGPQGTCPQLLARYPLIPGTAIS